jgi:predicted unusual protein kinase regulating ubiquinone biosynthesis (AarF/ABC1/UbiB family)
MAKRGLGGRIGRGARLARTGVRGLSGFAQAGARRAMGSGDPDQVHEQVAAHLAEVLGEMKGAAMKLGQLLSFVDLDLPPEVRAAYHDALATLRDDAPPFDVEQIEQVVTEEYGAPPEAVFASWEREPLAAASIGQVHAAKLRDGTEVVVKVQYPGVAEAVRADLQNAELFAPMARLLSPNQEIEPLLDELRERVDDELDYQREAQYQRAFANRYAGHPFILVPDVVADLCRNRVLVSERVHGRRFDELVTDAPEHEQQRVGEIIFRYAFGSIGRFRLFNGDPHPGNYLVAHDGRVAFVDYGSVKMFSRERYASMLAVDGAVIAGDRDGFLLAMRDAGFLPPNAGIDEDMLWDWFRLYTKPVLADQPFEFSPEFAAEVLRATSDPRSPYQNMLRRLNLPSDYLLLMRIHVGLNSVLGRLHARNDWPAIRAEYVDPDAPPATELGQLDAAWWRDRTPEVDPPA